VGTGCSATVKGPSSKGSSQAMNLQDQLSKRLALRPHEAATALGCSRDFFDEHISPELRWVRRGRLKLVAIAELEDWLRRSAARTLM